MVDRLITSEYGRNRWLMSENPSQRSHWSVGSDSVRAVQSSSRTACPPPISVHHHPQRDMEDKKNTEKKRKHKNERFLLVRTSNQRDTPD